MWLKIPTRIDSHRVGEMGSAKLRRTRSAHRTRRSSAAQKIWRGPRTPRHKEGMRHLLSLFLVFAVSLTACDDGGSTPSIDGSIDRGPPDATVDDAQVGSAADVVLNVAWDAPIGLAGRYIGWNIGRGTLYGPEDSPTHPEWRTPRRTEALAAMRTLRSATGEAPYMRYSGLQIDGSFGNDGYHFWDTVDPNRAITPADSYMAPFEYFELFRALEATPIIMVNFGSGTAAEAGEYIRHLVGTNRADPIVAARAHWSAPDIFPAVRIIELGNEVYAPWNTGYHPRSSGYAAESGDPAWRDRPSSSAANYAARALTYIEAIQAELGTAVFWIPLSQADMTAWGGTDAAVVDLAPLLMHSAVEAVVVHQYHVDDTAEFGGARKNDPAEMMTLSERYRPLYANLRAALGTVNRPTPLQIAITEYHVAGAFARGQFTQGDTAALGLGMADMLISYAQLGIEHLCEHMALDYTTGDAPGRDSLFEPWYPPYREIAADAPLVPRANTVVKQLFASHVRARRVQVEVIASPVVAGHGGDWPAVHAAAFGDDTELTLVVLHRTQDSSLTLDFELPEGFGVAEVQAFAPDSLTEPGVFEVEALAAEQAPKQGAEQRTEQGAGTVRLTLPRHSVVAVRATRR